MNNADKEYFRLLDFVLHFGRVKKNRTDVDTIGVFGEQARFNLQEGFPLLTTKKVFFKGIVHELLWFIKGDTNIKYLVDNNVHIWDEWAYARFMKIAPGSVIIGRLGNHPKIENFIEHIKNDTDFAKQWGELGEGTYGGMWRAFPFYNCQNENLQDDDSITATAAEDWNFGTVDQLKKVINKLKNNPDDRRMIVSAWHPYWVEHCALPPCHVLFHFNTEELTDWERGWIADKRGLNLGMTSVHEMNEKAFDEADIPKRRINLLLYQRSCDTFLGVPFNIASYALLLEMVAHCVNMVPGNFIHTYGDLHIYTNHLEQVKLQMSRTPRDLPKLELNPNKKDLFDFTYDDIKLIGYDPHPPIKGKVAV